MADQRHGVGVGAGRTCPVAATVRRRHRDHRSRRHRARLLGRRLRAARADRRRRRVRRGARRMAWVSPLVSSTSRSPHSASRSSNVVLGPAIGPCCYEFGDDDLAAVAAGVHADVTAVRSTTSDRRAWRSTCRRPLHGGRRPARAAPVEGRRLHRLRPTTVSHIGCAATRNATSSPSGESGRCGVNDADQVRERLAGIRDRIAAAGGGDDVAVLAVTKAFGPEVIEVAAAAGCRGRR